jgi:hypothetical protein
MMTKTSDILSVAGRVRDYLQAHHPALVSTLSSGHFFELSDEVMGAIEERAWDITTPREDTGNGFIPEDARLPAEPTILWCDNMADNLMVCHGVRSTAGRIRVVVFSAYMPPLICGEYDPGSVYLSFNKMSAFPEEHREISEEERAKTIILAAAILATINAPRITKRVVAGTRQSRRAMQRRFGAGSEQWHRIEWDLTKPKVERGERLGKGWHMPLHYTRGHWRRSEEGRGKAVLLPGKGWHTWVDGFWSGHPAYGIKRAVYAPRIGERADGRDRRTEVEGCEAAQ